MSLVPPGLGGGFQHAPRHVGWCSRWGAGTRQGLGHSQGSTARWGVVRGNPGSHIPDTVIPAKHSRTRLSTETNKNVVNVLFESLQRTSDQVLYLFLSYGLTFYFTFINQIIKQRATSSINQNSSIEVNSTAILFLVAAYGFRPQIEN